MSIKGKTSSGAGANLQLSFDVGHSSIGWAVLGKNGIRTSDINILGCGSVVFRADDCLASSRRAYRRQRRHIRSTRQRIARMKILLKHLGVLTGVELNKPGCAWPWKLAAQVLQGGKLLTWPELWDVLRWYAHNRGYDGNRRWSATETAAQNEDSEKEANARTLMSKFGTKSMAESFCAMSGINPLGKKVSANVPGDKRPKGQNAAFPREIVEREVRQILQRHFGGLKHVDANLERAFLGKDNNDRNAWQAILCPDLKLPNRYEGGLLFGQLVPRFDNRIISICPISGQKVPSRNCPEFLNFRWAMQLANMRVGKKLDRELRELNAAERVKLDNLMRERGYLTPGQLKDAVREFTGCERDNLDTMFMHPDAKEALLVDPVQKLISSDELQPFWKLFSEQLQKRLRGQWRRGKIFTLAQMRKQFQSLDGDVAAFDSELQKELDTHNCKAKKKEKQASREDWLQKHFPSKPIKLDGRAAFARHLLKQAYDDVLAGKPHPKEEGGCLFVDQNMRDEQLNRAIAEQTNNHLVRHRLLILERLLADIVKEYAAGKKERIGKITIEVNRDLREMSGKDSKAKDREMRDKLGNIRAVEKYVLDRLPEKYHNRVNGSFLRKARVADDLDWRCPYTGEMIQPIHFITGVVELDHVIPYALRPSNSLDSLVATFSVVNRMKRKQTAVQFMKATGGKPVCFVNEKGETERVEGMPNLSLLHFKDFKAFVDNLKTRGKWEHEQDKERRLRRKRLLEIENFEQKEFLPRDLTQTSQLVRLGAQVLRKNLPHLTTGDVTSLPGSVTGTVRKNWKLEGCLSLANPQVLNENGEAKTKTEIRDITHLHHALDACVLGIASIYFKNQKLGASSLWELLVKRKYNEQEKSILQALDIIQFDQSGNAQLKKLADEIKEQIRQRLAEKRVVQHVPADRNGMAAEETVWRVVDFNDRHESTKKLTRLFKEKGINPPSTDSETVLITRRIRKEKGAAKPTKLLNETGDFWLAYDEVAKTKLVGIKPESKNGEPKLKQLKAAKIIADNFGVAFDPQPTIIPFHKVWTRLEELKQANRDKMPRILRNGQLIRVPRGSRAGIWRVMSTKDTEAYGLALDLALPDRIKLDRGNAPIEKLIQDGMEILDPSFTGFDSSGVTIAEVKKRPRKPKDAGTGESCPTTSSA